MLTKLIERRQNCTLSASPNIEALFQDTRHHASEAGEKHKVAVIVCGPVEMVSETLRQCRLNSDTKVTFEFHYEKFDF